MLVKIIKILLSRFPLSFRIRVHNLLLRLHILRVQKKQLVALEKLINKEKINCVFFALFEECWKYDGVYQIMVKNPRFNPTILVCPVVDYGRDNMICKMDKCFESFRKKGYNVLKSYDINSDTYVDVKQELRPDIIFYTTPYITQVDSRYYITMFEDVLSVYVPYFMNSNKDYQMACNHELHNLVWRRYSETEYHRKLSKKYSANNGVNVVNTGYPGIESFLKPKAVKKYGKKKCIIWAPHHSIDPVGLVFYSCFLLYCDGMIDLAKKYSDSVFFVFKPHPLLRNKLNIKWGSEKTDAYYNLWKSMDNTSLNEGSYEQLFIESDGMIHDSASFIVEYLYLNKPVMRTLNGEDLKVLYNDFGLQCIDNHYKAKSIKDIEMFIQNVINGVDPLKEQRTNFVNKVLMPKGSPSQNIIDDILDSIDNQILFRN